jgi:uncharacterized protein (DUF1501 family)
MKPDKTSPIFARRQFLQGAASLTLAQAALPAWANATPLSVPIGMPTIAPTIPTLISSPVAPPQKLLVLIYLKGGNDAFNTLVPFADPKYKSLRPTLALPRENLLHLNEKQGMHAALKPLLSSWQSGDMAWLQGIGQAEITNQHYRDLEMQFTGAGVDEFLNDGWLTRALLAQPRNDKHQLDAIAFNDLDIREADPMGPFRGDKLRVLQVQQASTWVATRDLVRADTTASTPAKTIVKHFNQPNFIALKTNFGTDAFSAALYATVQLAAAGIAPPVVHITINAADGDHHHAFDTHWDQLKHHGTALSRLAEGLASFRSAMQEIGAWDHTLVASYDEFGRSPNENNSQGTHHGWSSAHLVLGGRVKGGLHGQMMPLTEVPAVGGPEPVIDTRALYSTIIESWWGQNPKAIFKQRFKALDLLKA